MVKILKKSMLHYHINNILQIFRSNFRREMNDKVWLATFWAPTPKITVWSLCMLSLIPWPGFTNIVKNLNLVRFLVAKYLNCLINQTIKHLHYFFFFQFVKVRNLFMALLSVLVVSSCLLPHVSSGLEESHFSCKDSFSIML